jgi:hypothetical protein
MISNYANSDLITFYGSGSYYLDNVKMYLWLGDPAMEIWTDTPRHLSVSHPSSIFLGSSQFQIEVYDNGSAVEDALVCISNNDDMHLWGYTNDQGFVTFNLSVTSFSNVNVTVTKHNYYPYQQTILVPAEVQFSTGWNFVSSPANHMINTDNIMVRYNNTVYNWTQATSSQNPLNQSVIDVNILVFN